MIGTKSLGEIRRQLKAALDARDTNDDPVQWLEDQMATNHSGSKDNQSGSEVLQSLQRFLKAKPKSVRRTRKPASTK